MPTPIINLCKPCETPCNCSIVNLVNSDTVVAAINGKPNKSRITKPINIPSKGLFTAPVLV